MFSLRVGSLPYRKYYTRMKFVSSDKHSSLQYLNINYNKKS